MIRPISRLSLLAIGVIASSSGAPTFGQGNTFNPYGNSGYADYREFTTPMYSNDPSLPGQARLQGGVLGRNRANQFESYVNSLDGGGDRLSRGTAAGVPYSQGSRFYGKDDRRNYRPNDTVADRQFQTRLNERNAAFAKALEEKDPRKRAVLLRRIEQDAVSRPLGSVTTKSAQSLLKSPARTPRPAPTDRVRPGATSPNPAAVGTAPLPRPGTATNAPEVAPTVNPAPVPIPAP